jgi:hypothetical protein
MAKARAMRHISRIDQAKKKQHGWWVRIHRAGRMIHRFFSDKAHGGKTRALVEAKHHRDELLRLHPKPARGNMFNHKSSRNTSGIAGVHRTVTRNRGRVYKVWQAGYVLPDGTHVNRKFHFSRGGTSEAEAKRKAIKVRAEGLKLIARIERARTGKRAAAKKPDGRRR